jgi:hypothetical protein
MRRYATPLLLLLLAVLVASPLLLRGCSCGHDFDFHLQSWLEAAAQFRHGTLLPRWAFSAAYNAGEPRFVFYPPLSWTLGGLLTLALPLSAAPIAFTILTLLAAAFAMWKLARDYTSDPVALLAAAAYIAAPYTLFTAFERTAYAELLAAAIFPWLIRALLHDRIRVLAVAIPIALLWLTNAPAAVMGCYALAVITLLRMLHAARQTNTHTALREILTPAAAGTALGLALAGFYLIPAIYERRFVQIAMAIIPNMRIEDNFLFGHTGDAPHDAVLHTASLIAVATLALATLFLVLAFLSTKRQPRTPTSSLTTSQPRSSHPPFPASTTRAVTTALVFTLLIAFLLTPWSRILWLHIPELRFLQFSWRLLALLDIVAALALTLTLRNARIQKTFAAALAIFIVTAAAWAATRPFRQPCDAEDAPTARATAFAAHRGVEPTDEYTPTDADNDVLRADDPPYWLATDPAAFAPGTTPNPAATSPNAIPAPTKTTTPGAPHLASEMWASTAPSGNETNPIVTQVNIHTQQPAFLILNLRAYPHWRATLNGAPTQLDPIDIDPRAVDPRDDGLLFLRVPAGNSTLQLHWQRGADETAGLILSAAASVLTLALWRRRPRPARVA